MADWRPNWRRPEAYAFTAGLSYHRWAWEFLRRNTEYQREFAEALRLLQKGIEEHGADLMNERYASGYSIDPKDDKFLIISRDLSIELRARWGIYGFVNFEHADPVGLKFVGAHQVVGYLSAEMSGLDEDHPVRLENHEALVRFDLRRALDPQLDRARELLKSFRQNMAAKPLHQRRRKDKWVGYLQVLDAKASGATYEKIAAVLFPFPGPDIDPLKKVDDALRQARSMTRSNAYLKLL